MRKLSKFLIAGIFPKIRNKEQVTRIFWLDSAIKDLARLRSFIASKNTLAASKAAKAIKDATNKLQLFPMQGLPVDGQEGFYDLFIAFGESGYHLRYKLSADSFIYIVYIKHSRELAFS